MTRERESERDREKKIILNINDSSDDLIVSIFKEHYDLYGYSVGEVTSLKSHRSKSHDSFLVSPTTSQRHRASDSGGRTPSDDANDAVVTSPAQALLWHHRRTLPTRTQHPRRSCRPVPRHRCRPRASTDVPSGWPSG